MRIGIDARFYGSLGKGLGRYTEKLITHLERLPVDTNEYVVFLRKENFDEYQPVHPRFTKAVADYPWYGWQEQLMLPRLFNHFRLDLVHFPHFNVPILINIPFVVTIHDLILLHFPTVKASELPPFLYWLKYLAYRLVIACAIRRSRLIIAVSAFTQRDIESSYPAARGKTNLTLEAADPFCYWVSPAAEQTLLLSLGLVSKNKTGESIRPFILYVGNAYPHKNLELLLDAAVAFPEYLFLCVGKEDYFYRAFREKVIAAGMINIQFVGYLDDASLGVLYRRAQVYFFPSLYEGFGLPGLEAMNYGVPVVAARAGSLPEVYGSAALYFDPTEPSACIDMLRQALSAQRNGSLRERGFSRVAEFSWRRMARDTLHLYHKAVQSK